MIDLQLPLTTEERELLVGLLNRELGDTRVEERHTEFSHEWHDHVKHQETLLRGLLEKLQTLNV